MFTTQSPPKWSFASVVVIVIIGVGSLSACRSGQLTDDDTRHPASTNTRVAPTELRGLSADRIDERLRQEVARNRELAERFEGVPADRIDEQLAREAAR